MMIRDLNKWTKRFIAFLSDMFVTSFSWLGAIWLTTNAGMTSSISHSSIFYATAIQCLFYVYCGLYRGVWRFASVPDLIRILKAVLLSSLFCVIIIDIPDITSTVKIITTDALLLFVLLSGSRVTFRWLRDYQFFLKKGKPVLIVGGGNAAETLIRDLYRSRSYHQYLPIVIVDDDITKHGYEVQGVRIVGTCKEIPMLVKKYHIELILIATPSANTKKMREIVQYCEAAHVSFRTLPSLRNIADGSVTVNSLREVLLDDLLGREKINLEWSAIKESIVNKTILVTGGGGSIGSELCRQIAKLSPNKLIIVDNCEYNLYLIDMELRHQKNSSSVIIHSHLCNITDSSAIEMLFGLYQPDLVFHVAAYKHVPLLENHIVASMHNNIIGTKIVAECAHHYHVKSFVLISTDKAVNPSSMMGATKRAAEIVCQALNSQSSTRFITVRFGNVLDSAGSVIPLFRSQLQQGGPLTVTHPEMTRYFMTIPEASQLILQANTMNHQADIFVLDMGEPININYLAEQMIKLSGKVVGEDIDIVYTGLRPGEKLYEELFHEDETMCETTHPKIKQAKIREYHWPMLVDIINEIEKACHHYDEAKLKQMLYRLVPEYRAPQLTKPVQILDPVLENCVC